MNKIVASLGMVALGASSLSTASAQESSTPYKFWNVSASLRGFYDDNVSTLPSSEPKHDTFGIEVSPGIGLNWETDTTKVKAGYRYALKYYDDKPVNTTKKYDQDHMFDLMLDHVISERFRVGATDSFVIGQEPDALRVGPLSATQRIPGENIRNYGTVTFDAQITRLFGLEVGYANSFFDYAADDSSGTPSNSGLLDRIEHKANVDGRLQVAPSTTAVAGYAYGQVDYTADESIGGGLMSSDRDSRSHYGYLGADHMFNPDLTGSIRGGIQYIDFYNLDNTDVSPYVQLSLKYLYAPESHVQVGFTQARSPINLVGSDPTDPVRDADTSVLFGSVRHRIVPNLFGSVIGTFQNAKFNGGGTGFDGKNEQYYQLGLNVEYQFTPNLSAEVGYNYDNVVSDVSSDREYDRNRVYMGVTARY